MKYLLIISILLFGACKKESAEVQTAQPPTVTPEVDPTNYPCAGRMTYGDSCAKHYGDLITGTWVVFDSTVIMIDPDGSEPASRDTIKGTHECVIYDSVLVVGKDTVKWFYVRNLLNKGSVCSVIPSGKDSFQVDMPKHKGFNITTNEVWLLPLKNYTYYKKGVEFFTNDSFGKKYTIQSTIYMRMWRK